MAEGTQANAQGRKKNLLGETRGERAVSISAIVLSAILIPVLILNIILIVKSVTNPDEIPSIGSRTPLIVLTESMEDEIHDGDLIVTKATSTEDIKEGDVISYFDPASKSKSVVTHRVIKKITADGKVFFKTQGDNNDIADRHDVPAENVIGVWTGFRVRFLGNVMLFMQSPWGLILCIALPAAAFVLLEVMQKRRRDKANQSDIDRLKAELEALKQSQSTDPQSKGDA